jgi:hypothetical protein
MSSSTTSLRRCPFDNQVHDPTVDVYMYVDASRDT